MPLRKSLIIFVAVLWCGLAFAADSPAAQPLLPKQFAGWQIAGPLHASNDPLDADASDPALLKEYGFTDFASATYKRDDGRTLTIKAARFADATGAFGAFTDYKTEPMLVEKIGDKAASFNNRILFFRANILVDAVFQRLSVMSAAELRELAASLPALNGGGQNPPSLSNYLPSQAQVNNSVRYVVGPVGFNKLGATLPADLIRFGLGAEVAAANYQTASGEATLMAISYPTPQIAAKILQQMDAAHSQNAQPDPNHAQSGGAGKYFDRRTGPIIVVASGAISESDAKNLLSQVNYDADVTWNQNTYFRKKDNVANLLVNAIVLCGIIGGLAIVAGIAFGGLRVLYRNMLPEQIQKQQQETEFISLHLSDKNH